MMKGGNWAHHNRKIDENEGFFNCEDGPLTKILGEYGVEKRQVVAPVVGAFAEMLSHVCAVLDLIDNRK